MECPKCKTHVSDNETVCPKCHKVLQLECPNCHSLGMNSVCEKCGYNILVKCTKCSKITPIQNGTCTKCSFPLKTSLAYQECESDEFAAITVKFASLPKIRSLLKSKELYAKFLNRIKNLLYAQLKGSDIKLITYGTSYVINFNRELSFATSCNKATRLAIKITNAFVELNNNVFQELRVPLGLTLTINKKKAEELLDLKVYESNVKLLNTKKINKPYLKGLGIYFDQYVQDEISKDYKTDSLYSLTEDSQTIMFYELILDSYILPPSEKEKDTQQQVSLKEIKKKSEPEKKDMYSFKVFDINAKCSFKTTSAIDFFPQLALLNPDKEGKIISIKTKKENTVSTKSLVEYYERNEAKVITITCTEAMSYKPWGFFEALFKDFFGLPYHNRFIDLEKVNQNSLKVFKPLLEFVLGKPVKAMSPEDARFAYMEYWGKLLTALKNTVIIVEGFENLDDTSIQTLELYFDKFKKVVPNFVFITSKGCPVHTRLKGLLRTELYTEFSFKKETLESCLSTLKSDATDFINSFYFEKIQDNFNGSYLYFESAIKYLQETGVLIDFDNKLIIKSKKSVILPQDLKGLMKARMKNLSKDMELSLILAYAGMLSERIDFSTLTQLGIKNLEKHSETLIKSGLVRRRGDVLYLNNYEILLPVITASLKKEAEEFLAKNIIAQIGKGLADSTLAFIMGRLRVYKEEYLTLWKNAQFAINTGDYDAYLKNCLGFLSLVEHIEANISKEDIEANKKEVYNNILLCLYNYSPAKIYNIENMLLMDAISSGDNEKIVKLSNLMLQGALISSNYTDALGLLHNILSRMPSATLVVNDNINTKFLLLSLVNIEILYNIGDFRRCIETAEEILAVLSPEVLEQAKPASFSTNLFVTHVMETLRLAGLAKLYTLDNDLEDFFEKINNALNVSLPERDCILAIKDYLAGKVYSNDDIEKYSAYSKVIFLILQELSLLKDDYKRFAQNIYQAKLLALDIHQKELELLCDLFIAYAYFKSNVSEKAEAILNDIHTLANNSAMFNILMISKYLLALIKINSNKVEEALLLINDALASIRRFSNQPVVLFALFEKLYIEFVKAQEIPSVDIESEELKIAELKTQLAVIMG